MAVKVSVKSVYDRKGFEQAQRDAKSTNQQLQGQFAERGRLIDLQRRIQKSSSKEQKDALRGEASEIRRGLQMRRLVEQQEKKNTRELKEQIRSQRRLNSLTEKLNRDLKKQADERRRSRQQRVDRVRTGVGAGAAGVGAGIALAADAVRAADQAAVTGSAFNNLSGSAEQAAKNMEAMRRATRDLASEQEQQAIANQLLGMGIVNTSDELEKVVEVSRRLGGTFKGLGAREAADDFALMISNMSFARLDSFGISSGKVRKRVNELQASTAGMTKEAAFFQATMAEADQVLGRIGPELETTSNQAQKLSASFADFKVSIGELITTGGDGGLLGMLDSWVDSLNEGAQAWQGAITNINDLGQAQRNLSETQSETTQSQVEMMNSALDWLPIVGTVNRVTQDYTAGLINAVIGNDEFATSYQGLIAEQEAAAEAQSNSTASLKTNTAAVEDNSEANEEAAKRMERVASIRRDAAGELLDIEAQLLDDLAEANQDYHEEQAAEVAAALDRVADLEEKAAKDRLKISKKLGKDISKTEKDLAKDLQKIEADTAKKIKRLTQDAARESGQDSRKRRIDALGDERLFQFELQNLAADGEALQIIEAQKRREIEKQIEGEKMQEEQQAEDEDLQVKIQRLKEDAQDRMREERAQADERKAMLQEQAEEDRALLEERLEEETAAENEALQERLNALTQNREERVTELHKGREEAIAALAQELAEAKELTQQELAALVDVAGKLGEDVGTSFADGISKGSAKLKDISSLLGEAADFTSPKFAGAGKSKGFGFPGSGKIPGFASGGAFTVGGAGGPDSQLVQFMATPGEQVAVGGAQTNNINISIPMSGGADEARIQAVAERHVQALVSEMEEMMGS